MPHVCALSDADPAVGRRRDGAEPTAALAGGGGRSRGGRRKEGEGGDGTRGPLGRMEGKASGPLGLLDQRRKGASAGLREEVGWAGGGEKSWALARPEEGTEWPRWEIRGSIRTLLLG